MPYTFQNAADHKMELGEEIDLWIKLRVYLARPNNHTISVENEIYGFIGIHIVINLGMPWN